MGQSIVTREWVTWRSPDAAWRARVVWVSPPRGVAAVQCRLMSGARARGDATLSLSLSLSPSLSLSLELRREATFSYIFYRSSLLSHCPTASTRETTLRRERASEIAWKSILFILILGKLIVELKDQPPATQRHWLKLKVLYAHSTHITPVNVYEHKRRKHMHWEQY